MARVVVATLVVCLARADEYGGVRMPQYGALDDYRGHSPDASAPLDYKYEEDAQGNTNKLTKDIESNKWKNPARKQRGLRLDRDELTDGTDAAPEPFYKSNSGRWQPRDRPRPAGEPPPPRARAEPARRRSRRGRRGRARDYDFQPMDRGPKADYRVDKHNIIEEDDDVFPSRATTELIIPKKPRERLFDKLVKPQKNEDFDLEPGLVPDRRLRDEVLGDLEEEDEGASAAPPSRPSRLPPPPPPLDDDEDEEERLRARPRFKEYPDYNGAYAYDVRRLPMLVRRTTTRPPGGTPSPSAPSYESTTDLLAMLWTARRALPALSLPSAAPPPGIDRDPKPQSTTESPKTTTSTITSPSAFNFMDSTRELSIAEKSRLSILKKSQKKENDKGDPSKKPPVLLQVTRKMATIVMVEPPTRADPWMRARRVSGDSPQQLEKVKRLMRQKLVAGAKSIQELTDNWDDLVCDYIDVSLIDRIAPQPATLPLTCLSLVIIFVIW